MTRHVLGFIAAIATASAVVAAQSGTAATDPQSKKPDVTVTGCLTQGTAPTVFILDNARTNPKDRTEKARTFRVAAGAEDVDLIHHLNQEVQLTGMAEDKVAPPPAPGEKVKEQDLPKLDAKALISVADSCTAATR